MLRGTEGDPVAVESYSWIFVEFGEVFQSKVSQSGFAMVSAFLGRALGHFIFSFIGLKRILFTNIFQKL